MNEFIWVGPKVSICIPLIAHVLVIPNDVALEVGGFSLFPFVLVDDLF